jgi:hypothetical protein
VPQALVPHILLDLITYIIFRERKLDIIADYFRGLQVLQTNGGEITPSWVIRTTFHIHTNLHFFSTFDYVSQCEWNHCASLRVNCLSVHLTAVSPAVVHIPLLDYAVETSVWKKPNESCRRKFTIGFPGFSFPLKSVMPESWRCYSRCGNDLLLAGRSGDQIPLGARFFAPVHNGSEAHPASYTMGTGSFPGVKRPGRGVDHPPPPGAEVNEIVELYTFSPSGPS